MQGGSKKPQGAQGVGPGAKTCFRCWVGCWKGLSFSRIPRRGLNLHPSWGAGLCSMSTVEGVQTGSGGQGSGSMSAVCCLPPTFRARASEKEGEGGDALIFSQ